MRIKGGQAIVKTLLNCNVATVYGQPGVHVLDIYEALRRESKIKHVLTMHETNAAFMADAHGRLTGQPGVCLMMAGPGATNAVTPIAQAYTDSSPVVQITGHCGTDDKIQPFHGVDDWDFLSRIYSPITKWSVQIGRAEDIAPILTKAFDVASSGRPGPVHVEVPRDVLSSSAEFHTSIKGDSKMHRGADEVTVKRIAETLMSSDRPLVVAGKAVLREFCWEDVMKLSKVISAPIITVQDAMSAIPYDFPLYVGYDLGVTPHPSVGSLVKEADAIITFGLDLGERLKLSKETSQTLINVYNDAVQTTEEPSPSFSKCLIEMVASVKQTVNLLLKMITHERSPNRQVENKVLEIKRKIKDDVSASIKFGSRPIHPGEVGAQLRAVLAEDAIVTLDYGDSSTWMCSCFRARQSNTVLAPGRYASMGFALPAAISAKLNFPEREAMAVTGDGGFLMSCMDFPTAVKYDLAVKVVVMTNGHYGTIWHHQRRKYMGHTFATELRVPDFAKYAQSFGAEGFNVDEPRKLRKVLEEAVAMKGPVIVGVHTDHKFPCYRPGRTARRLAGLREKMLTWKVRANKKQPG